MPTEDDVPKFYERESYSSASVSSVDSERARGLVSLEKDEDGWTHEKLVVVVVDSGACVCALPLNAARAYPLQALESTDNRTYRAASGSTIEATGTRRPQVYVEGLYGPRRHAPASGSLKDGVRRPSSGLRRR